MYIMIYASNILYHCLLLACQDVGLRREPGWCKIRCQPARAEVIYFYE